jgi:hypothetical protein
MNRGGRNASIAPRLGSKMVAALGCPHISPAASLNPPPRPLPAAFACRCRCFRLGHCHGRGRRRRSRGRPSCPLPAGIWGAYHPSCSVRPGVRVLICTLKKGAPRNGGRARTEFKSASQTRAAARLVNACRQRAPAPGPGVPRGRQCSWGYPSRAHREKPPCAGWGAPPNGGARAVGRRLAALGPPAPQSAPPRARPRRGRPGSVWGGRVPRGWVGDTNRRACMTRTCGSARPRCSSRDARRRAA